MNTEIYADDLSLATDALRKKRPVNTVFSTHNEKRFKEFYDKYALVSSGDACGELLGGAMKNVAASAEPKKAVFVGDIPSLYGGAELSENCETAGVESVPALDHCAGFITVDCNVPVKREKVFAEARALLDSLAAGKGNACVVCAALPATDVLPGSAERLAEREYGWFLERGEERTPERDYCAAVEKLCREYVAKGLERIFLLRLPNLFSSDRAVTPDFDVGAMVKEICSGGTVRIVDGDFDDVYSFTYASDAAAAAVHILYNGEKGNVYNFVSFRASAGDMKLALHREYRDVFSLSADCAPSAGRRFHCLDRLKYSMTSPSRAMNASRALRRVAADIGGAAINVHESTDIYAGKLGRINEIEMEILREIDRICEKHGISYFLAGGTMLGAVRNGRNIPWDDDIDIAFLREDFDRFRAAADEELSDRFVHSCYYNDTKSFYATDKIRFKNTYFSTKYSSINKVPDGVFIDLLVHDNTPGNETASHAHREVVFRLRDLVERLWQDLRRDQIFNPVMKLAYPVLRKVPLSLFQKLTEKSYVLFRHAKESGKVIDSTGKIIRTAMLPGREMHKTKRVPFEDGEFPIPEDPEPYLTYVYGDDYIHEPPLSKRAAPHSFARIDLGEYLFSDEEDGGYRDVDLRGELFEKERGAGEDAT